MPRTTITHALHYDCWSVIVNLHTFEHITTISCLIYSRHGQRFANAGRSFSKITFKKIYDCIWMLMDGMRGYFF